MTYRSDANQKDIVFALRQMGATVLNLAAVKGGCPDVLVGWRGTNYLFEIKNMAGRGRILTPAEKEFRDNWRGQTTVIASVDDAIDFLENVD